MPAVPQDLSYAIEVQIEDTITAPYVVFQTAVLHTTCFGIVIIHIHLESVILTVRTQVNVASE